MYQEINFFFQGLGILSYGNLLWSEPRWSRVPGQRCAISRERGVALLFYFAMINCHRLNGLKTTNSLSYNFVSQKSHVALIGLLSWWRALLLCGDLYAFYSFSRPPTFLGPWFPSSIFKACNGKLSPCHAAISLVLCSQKELSAAKKSSLQLERALCFGTLV